MSEEKRDVREVGRVESASQEKEQVVGMRIIKAGKPKKTSWRKTCSCGCVFEYESGDVKGDPRDGDYVQCPTCQSCINVKFR